MPHYYVNRNEQNNGDHEVHTDGCPHPPDFANRHDLGFHSDCRSAVRAAKYIYPQSNGCYWCCTDCHTT
ncbi:MAG: hypothetical protein EP340_10395 [Alphaproteobacteria bacterium]|nr:MAG: hypothetical protein EP340_10395 [Alphaproteobacteria bacterium]